MGKRIWIRDEAYWALIELRAILRANTHSDAILKAYEIVKKVKEKCTGAASDLKEESK